MSFFGSKSNGTTKVSARASATSGERKPLRRISSLPSISSFHELPVVLRFTVAKSAISSSSFGTHTVPSNHSRISDHI
jgi:hypothetical protein